MHPLLSFFGLGGPELVFLLLIVVVPVTLVTLGIVAAWLISRKRPLRQHRCPHCGGEFED